MTAPPIPTKDDREAERRFQNTYRVDPFPKIAPSLLNSSDIFNYVGSTGMICPFDERRLKSASYAITIGRKVIYWDGRGVKKERNLKEGNSFVLPPNSIVFVLTMEKFRLPDYIAIRFNLKINNVHKGLLLGTGPIVDPGFVGNLLVPLHNLTTNEYEMSAGDTFAWVEFTKVSSNPSWEAAAAKVLKDYELHDKYVPFPENKKNLKEWDYILDASGNPIRSSIPDSMEAAKQSAKEAQRNSFIISFVVVVSVVAVMIGVAQLVEQQRQGLSTIAQTVQQDQVERLRLETRLEKLEAELRALREIGAKKK